MNWDNRFAARTSQMRRSAVRELLKLAVQPGMISFAGGLPATEALPVEEVKQATELVLRHHGAAALQYGQTEGTAELRDWIAHHFSRSGFEVRRENVLITTGAQQALDLVGRVFLNEGDSVVVEDPTYLALLMAWRATGARFLPVQTDAAGILPSELEPLLAQRPKLVYCVPNFQNPQGTTLALERRLKLIELLRRHDALLVEDNPYGDLRYEGEPLPNLIEMEEAEGRVLHIGTFSKTMAPGLRVGWVIAPQPVIEKLVIAKQSADLHTSTFCQQVLFEILKGGALEQRLPRLRSLYRERRDAMLAALENWFPRASSWTKPQGGMFLMLGLPAELRAAKLLKHALKQGVAFVPGEEFYVSGGGLNMLRLNFSNSSPETIEQGVKRLRTAMDQMQDE